MQKEPSKRRNEMPALWTGPQKTILKREVEQACRPLPSLRRGGQGSLTGRAGAETKEAHHQAGVSVILMPG